MILEMFSRNKAFALSVYNLVIYVGRAVSFASGVFVGCMLLFLGVEDFIFFNELIMFLLMYLMEIGVLGVYMILYIIADVVVLTLNVGIVLENIVGDVMLFLGMLWY